jgi:hypothetical protein
VHTLVFGGRSDLRRRFPETAASRDAPVAPQARSAETRLWRAASIWLLSEAYLHWASESRTCGAARIAPAVTTLVTTSNASNPCNASTEPTNLDDLDAPGSI